MPEFTMADNLNLDFSKKLDIEFDIKNSATLPKSSVPVTGRNENFDNNNKEK